MIAGIRYEFESFEQQTLQISTNQLHHKDLTRKKKRKLCIDETRDNEVKFTGRDTFRINSFNTILDKLSVEFQQRCLKYKAIYNNFTIITQFGDFKLN